MLGRVDVITGTLGKALGGASGGYTSGRKEIVGWLRQRSRPYLFSNTLAPVIAATSLAVLDLLEGGGELRAKLQRNSERFRGAMSDLGFELAGWRSPHHPRDAGRRPRGRGDGRRPAGRGHLRDRVLLSGRPARPGPHPGADVGGHDDAHIDAAVAAFAKVGRAMGVIA